MQWSGLTKIKNLKNRPEGPEAVSDSMNSERQNPDVSVKAAVTHGRTTDPGLPAEECLKSGEPDPGVIVILGASGDLTARKILPALFNLYLNGGLPDPFLIIGCSRTRLTDQTFRDKMKNAVKNRPGFDRSKWQAFARGIYYRPVDYGDLSSFLGLAKFLMDLDIKFKTGGNRIFYLAIPPAFYKTAAKMIGRAGLAEEEGGNKGWSRIVIEKPFGRDLMTAIDLDRSIHRYFQEHQIFRIDHYLAKETVQNVLMFRFANAIFEPIWNRRYIEYISITAAEALGVGHRARRLFKKSGQTGPKKSPAFLKKSISKTKKAIFLSRTHCYLPRYQQN